MIRAAPPIAANLNWFSMFSSFSLISLSFLLTLVASFLTSVMSPPPDVPVPLTLAPPWGVFWPWTCNRSYILVYGCQVNITLFDSIMHLSLYWASGLDCLRSLYIVWALRSSVSTVTADNMNLSPTETDDNLMSHVHHMDTSDTDQWAGCWRRGTWTPRPPWPDPHQARCCQSSAALCTGQGMSSSFCKRQLWPKGSSPGSELSALQKSLVWRQGPEYEKEEVDETITFKFCWLTCDTWSSWGPECEALGEEAWLSDMLEARDMKESPRDEL